MQDLGGPSGEARGLLRRRADGKWADCITVLVEQLGLERVQFTVDAANVRSQRALERVAVSG